MEAEDQDRLRCVNTHAKLLEDGVDGLNGVFNKPQVTTMSNLPRGVRVVRIQGQVLQHPLPISSVPYYVREETCKDGKQQGCQCTSLTNTTLHTHHALKSCVCYMVSTLIMKVFDYSNEVWIGT